MAELPLDPNIKSKVNDKFVVDRLIEAIKRGATNELAARYASISPATLYNWLATAEQQESGKYVEFSQKFYEAKGKAAYKWLGMIDDAMPTNWQAAAWKLERTYPTQYGKTVQSVEVSGAGGGPITIADWREEAEKNRKQADETMRDFEDG